MKNVEVTHSYKAIYRENQGYYTISFPELDVDAIGFKSLADSKSFARDLLAEILIDRERGEARLISQQPIVDESMDGGISESVEINIDSYKEKFSSFENRTFKRDEISTENEISQEKTLTAHATGKLSLLDKVSKRMVVVTAAAVIVCLIACISIINGINERNWENEIQETIQVSRNHISSQEYEQGYRSLDSLRDNPETGDYAVEIESLYDYALLKDSRENSGGLTIEEQYECSQKMMFETDDELYQDAANLAAEIKNEYDEEQRRKAEEEAKQAVKEEAEEAKERKAYLEKLSTTIPFEGMEEEFIDCTACGAHSEETIGQELYSGTFNLYRWYIDDEQVMEVYCKNGEVDFADIPVFNDGSISDYWTDDRKPLFESKKKTPKFYSPESNHDEDLDKYLTGKAYADDKLDEYRKELGVKYSSLTSDEIDNVAWVKAFNAWLNMHSPKQKEPVINAN